MYQRSEERGRKKSRKTKHTKKHRGLIKKKLVGNAKNWTLHITAILSHKYQILRLCNPNLT